MELNDNDHLVITEPDRFHSEGTSILFVDFQWDMVENTINILRGHPERLVFHVFRPEDRNYAWLLDVAHQADIIVMDLGHQSHMDPLKGVFLPWTKTYYIGRSDLRTFYGQSIDDLAGQLLVMLGERQKLHEQR